jgi:hypothetical protein
MVREIWADHIQPLRGRIDRSLERHLDREMTLTWVVVEDLHRVPAPSGIGGKKRSRPPARSKRATLEMPRQQEDRLELGDDRPLEPEHEVVGTGHVMVLDAGPTHIADAAVDDDDLPMVEVAEVVQAPVDATLTEEPVEVQERALVRHDLHAAVHERAVELLRPEARLAECRLGDDADADTGGDLFHQYVPESIADLACLETEDQDVDVTFGRFDVLEHPGEELGAIDEQVHPRSDRGVEVQRQVAALPASAKSAVDDGACTVRRDERGRFPIAARHQPSEHNADGGEERPEDEEAAEDQHRRAPRCGRPVTGVGSVDRVRVGGYDGG